MPGRQPSDHVGLFIGCQWEKIISAVPGMQLERERRVMVVTGTTAVSSLEHGALNRLPSR